MCSSPRQHVESYSTTHWNDAEQVLQEHCNSMHKPIQESDRKGAAWGTGITFALQT